MKCFKIEEISYGWFEFSIGKHWAAVSDFLSYDMPREFLSKLIKVLEKSSKERIYLMYEPRAELMEIFPQGDKIAVKIYSMDKHSYELSPVIEEESGSIGDCKFLAEFEKASLTDDVVAEFSLYEKGNGRKCYEKNWGEFPQKEYDELKRIAFEINKNQSEFNELKCVDYLEI